MLKMLIIFISIQKTVFSLWQLQLEVLKYSDSSLNGLDKEKEKHFCRIFFLLWDQISENKPNILSISFIWSAYFLTFSKLLLAPDIEPTFEYINKYGFPSTGPILGIYRMSHRYWANFLTWYLCLQLIFLSPDSNHMTHGTWQIDQHQSWKF